MSAGRVRLHLAAHGVTACGLASTAETTDLAAVTCGRCRNTWAMAQLQVTQFLRRFGVNRDMPNG